MKKDFQKNDTDLTQQTLKQIISYNAETGKFVYLVDVGRWGRVKAGSAAGFHAHSGYLKIMFLGKKHYAHRLAWLYVHGEWPRNNIDHINGDKTDNRICNLRDVSQSINMQNMVSATKKNKLGVLGVHERRGKFSAHFRHNNKHCYVGDFPTLELAKAAYNEVRNSLIGGAA